MELATSSEKLPGVQEREHYVAKDTRTINTGAGNVKNISMEDCNKLLCQLMVKASIVSNKKEAVKTFEVSSMLTKKSYKVKEALRLPNCPSKLAYVTLNTGAGPNIVER